jgi:hypothetical protein
VPKKITGSGPGGTLTPLDGKVKPSNMLDKPKQPTEIKLPAKFLEKIVTAKSLSKGNYQKQILAFFASHAAPVLMNSLITSAREGNVPAMRLLAEMYSFIQKGNNSLNILVNQNNQNNNGRPASDDGSLASFEEIARNVSQNRQLRMKTIDQEPVFVPTPED